MEEALLNPGAPLEVYREDRRAAREMAAEGAEAAADAPQHEHGEEAAQIPMRAAGNTGPKGVLADYRDAEVRLAQRLEQKRAAIREQAERNSHTVRPDAEDDEDDAAFAQYRQQRMAELQQQQQKKRTGVRRLTTDTYMTAVQEAEDPDRFVVVHIFSERVAECSGVGQKMAELARRQNEAVEFCDISLQDALDTFDEEALPAVLVYRRGQPVQCHLRVQPSALVSQLVTDGVLEVQHPQSRKPVDDDDDDDDDDGDDDDDDDDDDDN